MEENCPAVLQKEGQNKSVNLLDNEPQLRVSNASNTDKNSLSIMHKAGNLKHCFPAWQKLTSDHYILNVVKGLRIEFKVQPKQAFIPKQYNFNNAEIKIIDDKIKEFLKAGIIESATHTAGEYISNIFIRPKKNGSYRFILNLKGLNEFVEYHHFKMENLKSAITLMRPNCYMATLDLKDAYYSVSII